MVYTNTILFLNLIFVVNVKKQITLSYLHTHKTGKMLNIVPCLTSGSPLTQIRSHTHTQMFN